MRILTLLLIASAVFAQPRWSASRMLTELLNPLFPQMIIGIVGSVSPASGGTTWAYVSHMYGLTTDHDTVTTSAGSCGGANVITAVVTMYSKDPGTVAISNTSGSVWHLAVSNFPSGGDGVAIWYTDAKALSGSETVTGTLSTSYLSIYAECHSGGPVSGALDQTATGVASGANCQSSSITPSQANTLVIAGASSATTLTIDSSYTMTDNSGGVGGTSEGGGIAYLLQTAASATQPTISGGGISFCAIASLKH